MATTTTTSKQFQINWKDFLKGAIMAVGTPILYMVQELIPHWPLNPIEKVGLSALVSYLIKNFFSSSQIVVTGAPKATIQAVKQKEASVGVTDNYTGEALSLPQPVK